MKLTKTIVLCFVFLFATSCRKQLTCSNREIESKLVSASYAGNLSQVKLLIAQGANINQPYCGYWPAIQAAATAGKNETIQYLLSQGAQVDIGGKFNETALMCAAGKGHLETVKLLVANGANINAYDEMVFNTPLKIAKKKGYQEIAKYLESNGATETIWWHKFFI
jgi:ankyrin repeat protein